MYRRSRMPVRCWIHSSLVSMSRVRSALVTTRSGTWWPRPRMRELTSSLTSFLLEPQDRRAPRHAAAEGAGADDVPAPHAAGGQRIGERDRDAGGRHVSRHLPGRDDPVVGDAGGAPGPTRDPVIEIVDDEERDLLAGDVGALEGLADHLGEDALGLGMHALGIHLIEVAAGP